MSLLRMDSVDLHHKKVLIREDFNVPMDNGVITNDARLRAALPTIQMALASHATVILMSHLGRPKEGSLDPTFSLQPVASHLSKLLNRPVNFINDWQAGVDFQNEEIYLLENVRFLKGEKSNDDELAKQLAGLCDVFVMDAFASAHRAHASTCGVARFAAIACAGPLLSAEIKALHAVLDHPVHPVLAIVGGSKVSTKLTLLDNLCNRVDTLIVGGGIANTFLAAKGYRIGHSLYEPELISTSNAIMELAKKNNCNVPLPVDVVVAKSCEKHAIATIKTLEEISDDDLILDIGPKTVEHFQKYITKAKTIIWNGPIGVFEMEPFSRGTESIAKTISKTNAFSLVGGGDTVAAIEKYHLEKSISYVSTGGGAFLEMLEGKQLPGIVILEDRKKEMSAHGSDHGAKTSH